MEQYIFWVIQTVVTIVIMIIGYLMSRTMKGIDDKQKKIDQENTKIRQEINEFKIEVSKNYVTKQDFNETTGSITKKLDKIMDLIMDINKKI